MHVAAIIAAGGRGSRMGRALPKQWLTLSGETILQRSVTAFDRHAEIHELIVVVPADTLTSAEFVKPAASKPLRFVEGGARRQDSVANGFAAVSAQADIILIHDAARPLVTADLISRTIAATAASGAAIAAVPVHDTVKQAAPAQAVLFIERTLPRESVFLAQTPQGFRRDVLDAAIAYGRDAGPDATATDEASLAERAGHPVQIVIGDPDNLKITTEADLARAEGILQHASRTPQPESCTPPHASAHAGAGAADLAAPTLSHLSGTPRSSEKTVSPMKIGLGYDLHRLVEDRPLILGGVRIPYDRGLLGHSDADVVCHAVTDALLGAANLGDIGRLFPDTDPAWKDADSLRLLTNAWTRVRAAGYTLGNLDIVVIAQHVKISPHAPAIQQSLARALDVPADLVSIKGKTNEGVDTIGRGDAIAVHAVALLTRV